MIAKEIKKPASQDDIAAHAKRVFTARDKQILASHSLLADTIAGMFGKGCEVVIHSLEDLGHSIVKIVHGEVTGRSVGSPITDLGLKVANNAIESKDNIIGPYFSMTKAGKPLKSTTMIIRNDEGLPIGFLCINFDLSLPIGQFCKDFSPSSETPPSGKISPPMWADSSRKRWPMNSMPSRALRASPPRRKTVASSPISNCEAYST